jgi:hypothetical protein
MRRAPCGGTGLPELRHGQPQRSEVLRFVRTAKRANVGSQDNPQAARQKIAGGLQLLDESFREALPLTFDFLGATDPEQPTAGMDPEAYSDPDVSA